MRANDINATIAVDQSPEEVFNAVTNVRGWWSERIEGGTEKLHDHFTYQRLDLHKCTMKLIEVVPNEKVVWLCLDNYFSFTEDQTEWNNTTVEFEISEKDGKTELHFTHKGIGPDDECYSICNNAWNSYITGSLYKLITTGKGEPNPKVE
jgi:uncharacterized protein YndB with AHSA1/START domain